MLQYQLEMVEWLVRIFTGVIFLFQGFDKLFKVKIRGVVETFMDEASQHHINRPMVTLMAHYSSFIEFFGGIALILGLFTKYVLVLMGLDLLLAALAFSVIEPMWDMRHVFPRLALVVSLMLIPAAWSRFSLDYLINK